eukprot:5048238-Prymnesium_polylepis.1
MQFHAALLAGFAVGSSALMTGPSMVHSRVHHSRVATVEMAKKSVGDLSEADLKVRAAHPSRAVPRAAWCPLMHALRRTAHANGRAMPHRSPSDEALALCGLPARQGKKVLVRCDLNVPLDGKTISDDTRIRASIPTIEYLVKNGAKVLLSSHLGRPKSGPEDKFSLGPLAPRLSELLGKEVKMAPDCIGDG